MYKRDTGIIFMHESMTCNFLSYLRSSVILLLPLSQWPLHIWQMSKQRNDTFFAVLHLKVVMRLSTWSKSSHFTASSGWPLATVWVEFFAKCRYNATSLICCSCMISLPGREIVSSPGAIVITWHPSLSSVVRRKLFQKSSLEHWTNQD